MLPQACIAFLCPHTHIPPRSVPGLALEQQQGHGDSTGTTPGASQGLLRLPKNQCSLFPAAGTAAPLGREEEKEEEGLGAWGAPWQHRRCSLIKAELGILCSLVTQQAPGGRGALALCTSSATPRAGVALGRAGAQSWSISPGSSPGFVSDVAVSPGRRGQPQPPGLGESLRPPEPDSAPFWGLLVQLPGPVEPWPC